MGKKQQLQGRPRQEAESSAAAWLWLSFFALLALWPPAHAVAAPDFCLSDEDRLNLLCLGEAYPGRIGDPFMDSRGNLLLPVNGRPVMFRRSSAPGSGDGARDWDITESMAQPYPPEPLRPDTPPGVAPGRRRCYALLEALYGAGPEDVRRQLEKAVFMGQPLRLSGEAAAALRKVDAELRAGAAAGRGSLLKVDGSYLWRRIAGENAMSAHAYGIAIDIGARHAPYWRWSRINPHPMQASYPSGIVGAFERNGFIWGGKWHEYDLMHFEYRPELLCKGRRAFSQ